MDFKEKDTRILWSIVSEIANTMSNREVIPPSERAGTYKETSEYLYDRFKAVVCEIDDRMPDSKGV